MKKILGILVVLVSLFSSNLVAAPVINRQFQFTAATTSTGYSVIGLGVGFYKISYGTTGGASSACTVSLQGSTDNSTWSANIISGTTCTSDGYTTITGAGTANSYIRVNLSTFTVSSGSPTLTVNVLNYLDLQAQSNGSQILAPSGTVAVPGYSYTAGLTTGFNYITNAIGVDIAGSYNSVWNTTSFYVGSGISLGFSSNADPSLAGADTILARDAANVLAMKNGASAQEFRVYGTTTGPAYASLKHTGSSLILGDNDNSALIFQVASVNRWVIGESSESYDLRPNTDNTTDLGLLSVRIRNVYATAYKGSATNDSASAGFIGEIISSTIATGSSVTIATGSATPITSINLTAGDWDVSGVVDYTLGATTSVTVMAHGSLALNGCMTNGVALGAQDTFAQFETPAVVPTNTVDEAWVIPTVRVSIASTTTVCLIAKDTFSASTLKGYGTIKARRVR